MISIEREREKLLPIETRLGVLFGLLLALGAAVTIGAIGGVDSGRGGGGSIRRSGRTSGEGRGESGNGRGSRSRIDERSERVVELVRVRLETVKVLGRVGALLTRVLGRFGVGLGVRAQHAHVDARVIALVTLERLLARVIAHVILQVVLVLGHERTLGALEQLLGLDVRRALMHPVVLFVHANEQTLLAFE